MTDLQLIGLVGSIASIIGLFLGFTICKVKYKISSQSNWFLALFNFGGNKQKNKNEQ